MRHPLPGVALMVQDKQGGLLTPAVSGTGSVSFDFDVRVKPGATPDFLGPYVQGPPGRRFVYVNVGRMAGQPGSPWSRRAKVPLGTLGADLVGRAIEDPGVLLAAAIEGRGRDGGPSCATVPLSSDWRVVRLTTHGGTKQQDGRGRPERRGQA